MKWNSLPTSAIYAPVRKQNFLVKNLVILGRLLNINDQYTQTLHVRKRSFIWSPLGTQGYLQQPTALQPTVAKEASLRQSPRNLQVRYIHAGIGADSLFDLHNQILTLKETIMSLKPLVEKNDDIEDQLSIHDSSLNFDEMEISSTDYQKLQEEYNKLIFQKHKV